MLADRVAPEGSLFDTVAINNREAGTVAALHLLDLGHRRIALAASSLAISPIRERVRGATDLIRSTTGKSPDVVQVGSVAERGAAVLQEWLAQNARPSAILALTNVTTLSALSALARLKIDIPDPISLIGFDDYPWMSARKLPLTAMRQPIAQIAAVSWERLRARMSGDDTPARTIVLNANLEARDSVAIRATVSVLGHKANAHASKQGRGA